jgi:flagellar biogenesis protein FliO
MNVIPFPRVRTRPSFARPVEPPAALGGEMPGSSQSASEDDFEDRRRMQQNLAALLLVVVLLFVGAWMIDRLKSYSRTLACLESGQRYCTVLDPRHLPGR